MSPVTLSPAEVIEALAARADLDRTPCGRGTMVWRSWGSGPPVLLLHGGTGSWLHWMRNIEPLAAHFRVLVPDLPGYGDSDDPADLNSLDALVDAVVAGLERLAPPPAVLQMVGFSFGGIVGGLAAARMGTQVRTLVLSGTGGMATPYEPLPPLLRVPPGAEADAVMAAHRENLGRLMFGDPHRVDPLAVHVHVENLRKSRFRTGAIPRSDRLLQVLPSIRARLGAIWGERDAFAVPYVERRREILSAVQPGLDFRVIEGAGHWAVYEAANRVNADLLEMLERDP